MHDQYLTRPAELRYLDGDPARVARAREAHRRRRGLRRCSGVAGLHASDTAKRYWEPFRWTFLRYCSTVRPR